MLSAFSSTLGYSVQQPDSVEASAQSLGAAHVYKATFVEGPNPAVSTTCTAAVQANTASVTLHNSFSASAGGAYWAQESVIFTLSGAYDPKTKVGLKFASTGRGAGMMRISASTPSADDIAFKASDSKACPSEHCLMPDVSNVTGASHPDCYSTSVGPRVDQPISNNKPEGTPMLVDVTSLVQQGATSLKVVIVPEETTNGFWETKLDADGAQLVVTSEKCSCHGPTWMEIDDGPSGNGGHCYDKTCIYNKEAHWLHPLSDCARIGGQKSFCAAATLE